jgi:anaerobic magnesium-protoporphyrin IX monomethyl ester cyclase
MRFERVLLVSPPSSSYLGAARPPQNLGYLAQALDDRGVSTDSLDMRLGYKFRRLERTIREFEPDLIGISLVSHEYQRAYDLIRDVKRGFETIPIIAGGPHVTVLKERVLRECPEIDYGAVNEGEDLLADLCVSGKAPESIPGLIRREGTRILYGGPRDPDSDLDRIAFPRYLNFDLKRYIREIPINSSRGCPYQCVFCPNKIISKRYRARSAGHVADEIEYWYGQGYRVFNFDDDNFTLEQGRVYALCDEIERRSIRNAEFRCSNGIRADRIDRPLLARMKQVGFHYIAFGIDGGNDRVLRINKKGETIGQIDDAVRNACELGYDVKIFCITGMPGETLQDVEDSYRFVQKYPVQRVILNNPIPYPGTELFNTIQDNRLFLLPPHEYLNNVTENKNVPVFETPELDRDTRILLLKRNRQIEKRVTLNAVHRMYARNPVLRTAAVMLFASGIGERLFFGSNRFRQWVENIRFKRMLRTRNATGGGA